MKLEATKESGEGSGRRRAFGNARAASGPKIPAQISAVKAAIFAESYPGLQSRARLLWLALNEAEAAAWQTRYPQLVFPTLATEKVEAVIAWKTRQRAVQRASPVFALAA